VTVTNSKWDGGSFLQSDVVFDFLGDMRVEVAYVDVDFVGRVVILLGQSVEEFFNLTFAWTYIHACDVDGACD